MPDFVKTYCKECGLKEVMIKMSKKGKPYTQNIDYSFHTIPVDQEGGKTKWFHAESKDHEGYIKEHKTDEGYKLQKPYYTKAEMTKMEPPQKLEDNIAQKAIEKPATQTPSDVIHKFKDDVLVDISDKDILRKWVNVVRSPFIEAHQIYKDGTGNEKDERISTQGYVQNFTLFYSNMKLVEAINNLAKALNKETVK